MRTPVRILVVLIALLASTAICLCLGVATLVGGTGGAALLGMVTPAVAPATGVPSMVAGESVAAATAVSWALRQLGTPYRWGGEGSGGFDCSGLVQAAFGAAGVRLPRVAQDQFDAGPPVAPGAPLRAGDLVFFGSSPGQVDHVGIVVTPGEMVDAPHTGAVVRVEPIFSAGYVGATRPAP